MQVMCIVIGWAIGLASGLAIANTWRNGNKNKRFMECLKMLILEKEND
jgi:hypothetical protein